MGIFKFILLFIGVILLVALIPGNEAIFDALRSLEAIILLVIIGPIIYVALVLLPYLLRKDKF